MIGAVHLLINDLHDSDAAIMGKMMLAAQDISSFEGIAEAGYRLVINTNADAGQTVAYVDGTEITLQQGPDRSSVTECTLGVTQRHWTSRLER